MFDLHLIAFVAGLAIGSITTLKLSAWWYSRRIAKTKVQTQKDMAAKLVAL
jgi:hypothetical protein